MRFKTIIRAVFCAGFLISEMSFAAQISIVASKTRSAFVRAYNYVSIDRLDQLQEIVKKCPSCVNFAMPETTWVAEINNPQSMQFCRQNTTLLIQAASSGSVNCLAWLLRQPDVDIMKADIDGITAYQGLLHAIKHKRVGSVEPDQLEKLKALLAVPEKTLKKTHSVSIAPQTAPEEFDDSWLTEMEEAEQKTKEAKQKAKDAKRAKKQSRIIKHDRPPVSQDAQDASTFSSAPIKKEPEIVAPSPVSEPKFSVKAKSLCAATQAHSQSNSSPWTMVAPRLAQQPGCAPRPHISSMASRRSPAMRVQWSPKVAPVDSSKKIIAEQANSSVQSRSMDARPVPCKMAVPEQSRTKNKVAVLWQEKFRLPESLREQIALLRSEYTQKPWVFARAMNDTRAIEAPGYIRLPERSVFQNSFSYPVGWERKYPEIKEMLDARALSTSIKPDDGKINISFAELEEEFKWNELDQID